MSSINLTISVNVSFPEFFEHFFNSDSNCLLIGLGNEKSTPDSLGPKTIDNILVTNCEENKKLSVICFDLMKYLLECNMTNLVLECNFKEYELDYILKNQPHAFNAGVDINGFEPVTFEELKENNRRWYAQTTWIDNLNPHL